MYYEIPEIFRDKEIIFDPIWGVIEISEFEKKIISTREFQRLRRIKQLGFVNLVYPGAEHSRFQHSIGVCHLAKKLVDTINKNLDNNKKYVYYRLMHKDLESLPDENTQKLLQQLCEHPDLYKISPYERIVISLAALLHDISHAPFSHEIEGDYLPKHDDYSKNPMLFYYIFHKNSQIARLIDIYNGLFFNGIRSWFNALRKSIEPIREVDPTIYQRVDEIEKFNDFLNGHFLNGLDEGGYVEIKDQDKEVPKTSSDSPNRGEGTPSPIICGEESFLNDLKKILVTEELKLPLLGVMVFEMFLFEDESLSDDRTSNEQQLGYKEVAVSEDGKVLKWRPLENWFKFYRKDIFGNTICADLMDYIKRDGHNSGISFTTDVKFLDRMYITNVYKAKQLDESFKEQMNSQKLYSENAYEHIVFDVWDHKRGFARHSVYSEILAFLDYRFFLTERLHTHRVVEGARAMLQRIMYSLNKLDPEREKIPINYFHFPDLSFAPDGTSSENQSPLIVPNTDESFILFMKQIDQFIPDFDKTSPYLHNIKYLASCLEERRIYREIFIIDVVQPTRETDQNKDDTVKIISEYSYNKLMDEISRLESDLLKATPSLGKPLVYENNEPPLLAIVTREYGKKFKLPVVLTSQVNELGRLDIQPIYKVKHLESVKTSVDALKCRHLSLWKFYVFVHPAYHWEPYCDSIAQINKEIKSKLSEIMGNINIKNAISERNYSDLFPKNPLDVKHLIDMYDTQIIGEIQSLSSMDRKSAENHLRGKSTMDLEMVRVVIETTGYNIRWNNQQGTPGTLIIESPYSKAARNGKSKRKSKSSSTTLYDVLLDLLRNKQK